MSEEADAAPSVATRIQDGIAPDESERPEKPRGRPFEKGNSGRPRGSRNKTTSALEALLDGQAEAITRKIAERALEGDRAAMRLCFERILPLRPGRPLSFELPAVESAADVASAMSAIIAAVASGDLTPGEATAVSHLIESAARTIEIRDFDSRLGGVERRLKFVEKRNEPDTQK
jgi:hypothetical protein